nr:MAG TPA: tail protein [Caudoviricetes sp.]
MTVLQKVRIAVLDPYGTVLAHLDNDVDKAMPYWSDTLHTYLSGSAYTFGFKTLTAHEDAKYLVEGNKLSFKYKDKGYHLTIMNVEKSRKTVIVEAYGLSLELTNEQIDAYKSPRAMSFVEYIKAWGFERSFTVRINEVSNKSIRHDWGGTATVLSRLYSLANVFDAELEFITELNDDYSLKGVTLNVYRKHSGSNQGLGSNRTGTILRYPNDIHSIVKTSDITELYTGIRPTGTDGLQLTSLNGKKEYDANGNVEYMVSGNNLLAPQARDRFPSTLLTDHSNDMYAVEIWSYETKNVNTLYGQALAELKKHVNPIVTYDVDAYIDADIGDTFTIEDTEYAPAMYLQARIVEQEISFTDRDRCKTTFDNFTEVASGISNELIDEMNRLIEQNKTYQLVVSSSNGTVLNEDTERTVLVALVKDNGKDVTDQFKINWYLDGELVSTANSINVEKSSLNSSLTYHVEAVNDKGIVKASYELTVTKVQNGTSVYIKKTIVTYAVTDTAQDKPVTGWKTEFPVVPLGKYLWVCTQVFYSDGSSTETYSVSHNGTNGTNGTNGKDGKDGAAGEAALSFKLLSSQGQIFKNKSIRTTLTLEVRRGSKKLTSSEVKSLGTVQWFKNDTRQTGSDLTLSVSESDSVLNTNYSVQVINAKNEILGSDTISLASVTDIQGIYRFYHLGPDKPEVPTSYPPSDTVWSRTEPEYTLGNADNLYYVDCTLFVNLSFSYGLVQLSSDYEASKKVYADALARIDNAVKITDSQISKEKDALRTEIWEKYYDKENLDSQFGEISTKLEQTKNSVNVEFTNFKTDLDASKKQNIASFNEIHKYIRFIDGNIYIGVEGNPIQLIEKNDRLSFVQGGAEVAYFSNNKLYVNDGQFNNTLRIGNFEFSPRPNGSLDFKKASGN